MKIEYRKGNLLDADSPMIAHGCNAQGVMGSGVAKAIRAKWPGAYDVYRQKYLSFGLDMGEIVIYEDKISGKYILNCITQEYYGRQAGKMYVDYNAIKTCILEIDYLCGVHGFDTVAFPKIGAGLGGGDWCIISNIIEENLINVKPIIYEL